MFGISFSELGLIMAVALVVLGPARLPGLVRKVGRWVGKARTMAREFQHQLESEINLEELNRITDLQAKKSREEPQPFPPEGFENPAAALPAAESAASEAFDPNQLAGSGYPYGPQDPAETAPQPGDDTFSHAHAAGESPVADEPAEPVVDERKDGGAA